MSTPRTPLSRDRVLRAAIGIADAEGVEALTMRRLAREVDAEAMSLYHHVKNKDDVLDGVVDVIAAEINAAVEAIAPGPTWKHTARERILTARAVFLRHPWAPRVFENRTQVSFEVVRYHDRLVGVMRDGGFSYDLVHHALHALGSRALGFSQELFDPGDGDTSDVPPEFAQAVPNLVGMLTAVAHDDPDSTIGWCDDQFEFEFGLDLILDGLDRLRTA